MGRDYTKILKYLLPMTRRLGISSPTVVAYGSHVLQMANEGSDIDLILITKEILSVDQKNLLRESMHTYNIDLFPISQDALKKAFTPHFIMAAPLESAARYGEIIHGDYPFIPKMSDESFCTAMLIRALHSVSAWITIPDSRLTAKRLSRISMLLLCLENKIPLPDIYSFSHFCIYLISGGHESLQNDEIWPYLEESGECLLWLDLSFSSDLEDNKLKMWACLLSTRLKSFTSRLAQLKEPALLSAELKEHQQNHPLFLDANWLRSDEDFYLDETAYYNVVLKIIYGLNMSATPPKIGG